MNKDLSQETVQEAIRPEHFSRINPPDSVEAAQEKLEKLLFQEQDIIAQLEFTKIEEFLSEQDFYGWKKSAIKALAHIRLELMFLRKWTKLNLLDDDPVNISVIERYTVKVREIIEELSIMHNNYTGQTAPKKIREARYRYVFLIMVLEKITDSYRELGKISTQGSVSKAKLSEIRKELERINLSNNDEIYSLKKKFSIAVSQKG